MLPPQTGLHIGKQELEPVRQISHARIRIPLQLKSLWYDLHRPNHQIRISAGLEAKVEEARVFRIDAKGVGRSLRVGLSICTQPGFCVSPNQYLKRKDLCFHNRRSNLPVSALLPLWYLSCSIISSTFLDMAFTCSTMSSSRSL